MSDIFTGATTLCWIIKNGFCNSIYRIYRHRSLFISMIILNKMCQSFIFQKEVYFKSSQVNYNSVEYISCPGCWSQRQSGCISQFIVKVFPDTGTLCNEVSHTVP